MLYAYAPLLGVVEISWTLLVMPMSMHNHYFLHFGVYLRTHIGFTKSIMMVAINCREISTHPFSVHPHKHALEEIKCCKFYEQTLSILVSIIICL